MRQLPGECPPGSCRGLQVHFSRRRALLAARRRPEGTAGVLSRGPLTAADHRNTGYAERTRCSARPPRTRPDRGRPAGRQPFLAATLAAAATEGNHDDALTAAARPCPAPVPGGTIVTSRVLPGTRCN